MKWKRLLAVARSIWWNISSNYRWVLCVCVRHDSASPSESGVQQNTHTHRSCAAHFTLRTWWYYISVFQLILYDFTPYVLTPLPCVPCAANLLLYLPNQTTLWIKSNCDKRIFFFCVIADEFDAYIIVSFVNATLVLSIGDTVEEVTDSGFLGTTPTLCCSSLGDDALVQVTLWFPFENKQSTPFGWTLSHKHKLTRFPQDWLTGLHTSSW